MAIDGTTAPGYISAGACRGIDWELHRAGLCRGPSAPSCWGSPCERERDGVTLHAASVTLNDDYIGLGTTGTADANRGAGVYAAAGSSSELIGLNTSGDSGTVAT